MLKIGTQRVCPTIVTTPLGIPLEVSSNGELQKPTSSFTWSLPSNVTKIKQYCLYYTFYDCTGLTSVDLSNVITIDGGAMAYTFSGCTGLTSVDLSNVITIDYYHALYYAFSGCTSLTSVDLSSLTTIGRLGSLYEMERAFYGCTSLTSVDLSSLTTMYNDGALMFTFSNCTSLQTLSFPSLNSSSFGTNTSQFKGMLSGVTGCTVHFPSNLQSVIGSWSDVTAGFGGTNTTVLFDLPATT